MRSAKKSTKILSALSMAAVAAVGAKAHAASLSLFYGQGTDYANSPNGIFTATSFSASGSSLTPQSEIDYFGGATAVTPNQSGPTTINLPIGGYLSIAIDAVLTGNSNPQAGTTKLGDKGVAQPSFLGLAALGLDIASSDSTGTKLAPLSNQSASSPPATTIGGIPAYNSITNINQFVGANGGVSANAFSSSPSWSGVAGGGVVEPNLPGFDTTPNSNGGIGTAGTSPGAFPSGGSTGGTAGKTNGSTPQSLENFASASNTSTYAAASEFADQLGFVGLAQGTVTLTPVVLPGATEYWTFASIANSTHQYQATHFGAGDSIGALPVIIVNVGNVIPPSSTHPIISYSAASGGVVAGYGSQVGTLTVTGSNGSYTTASLSLGTPGDATGTVEAKTFSPASDEEIYALDVLVNGTQATAGELATLVTAINAGDSKVGASVGVVATTIAPSPDPFTGTWNLFLDPHGNADALLGIDLSSANDSNLSAYTFSAVAVVPEPMTLGLLALKIKK